MMDETNQRALLLAVNAMVHAAIHRLWREGIIEQRVVTEIYSDALATLEHGVPFAAGQDQMALDLSRRQIEALIQSLGSGTRPT